MHGRRNSAYLGQTSGEVTVVIGGGDDVDSQVDTNMEGGGVGLVDRASKMDSSVASKVREWAWRNLEGNF